MLLSLGQAPLAVPSILVVAAVLVALGRWRFDIVALLALGVAAWIGAVPAATSLAGYAEPAIAVIALVAVLGHAVRTSGVVDAAAAAVGRSLRWPRTRLVGLGALGGVCSAMVGSAGILPSILPAAMQERDSGTSGRAILLPLAFACCAGGLASGVGTLPNVLLDAIVRRREGAGVGLFDFGGTGIAVFVAVLAVATLALPLLRRGTTEASAPGTRPHSVASYLSEVAVPPGSELAGQTVWTAEDRAGGAVTVKAVVREGFRRLGARPDLVIEAGDVLVLSSEPLVLQRLMARSGLEIMGAARDLDPERMGVIEAVVAPSSPLVGHAAGPAGLDGQRMSLMAIGRGGRQPQVRLHRVKIQAGDVLVVQGELSAMPGLLAGLGCLPLAGRRLRLARRRQRILPGLVVLAALVLAASGMVPLVLALLAAVLVLLVGGVVTLDEAYAAVPWPVIVAAGALLPLAWAWGDGGAAAVANSVAGLGLPIPGVLAVGAVLALSLVLAPWVTGLLAVLIVAPLAMALAARLGLPLGGLLVAAAIGSSFELVPLPGRPANVAMLGAAGSRWRDLGLVGVGLALATVAAGIGAVMLVWHVQ